MATNGLKSFFPLIEQFTTQSEPAFCGISTLVIVLNALAIDPRKAWKGPWRWYEESMLNCCLDPEAIKETGITINDFRCLAICQGLAVQAVLVEDLIIPEEGDKGDKGNDQQNTNAKGVDKFRQAVKQACTATDGLEHVNSKDEYLVVSYSRKVVGQTGSGHFSPIAAYDSASDSVLILDTARFKYGAHWVSLPLLFEAMIPKDPDTGKSRGYILLSDIDGDIKQDSTAKSTSSPSLVLPSVLFRSHREQNPVRREFKDFLSEKKDDLDFDEVVSFWTKGGTDARFIWQMLEPQFTPFEEDEGAIEMIDSVGNLIHKLLDKVPHRPLPDACCNCRVNYSRTIDLTPREAIFVVYLAALAETKRKNLVMSFGTEEEATLEQTQLLAEAELVQYAIEMSDETFWAWLLQREIRLVSFKNISSNWKVESIVLCFFFSCSMLWLQ